MDQHRSGTRRATRKETRWDSDALWDWNLESKRIHFSPRWISLIGLQDHELGNTPDDWFQRVHPDDLDQLTRDIDVARAERADFDFRYRLRHKDGAYRWMSSRGVVVRNDGNQAIRLTGCQADVTVETVTDPVTRLPNRLLLLDRLAQSIDRARKYKAFHFAVLLIDLGRPEEHGRPSRLSAEDPLLTAAARRLETCLRIPEMTPSLRHNDLVARLDGDRFAILLDGLKDVSHAKLVGDRILRELLNPLALNGREVRLRASIGIAVSATGYQRADDALRDAETARYRAHVLGGSHCEVFDTAILESEQAELQLQGDFEAALERREFELVYQPIVSLASKQVVGFEALVRWQHPVLGMIAPLDFIPLAEATGFIVPLGNWILRDACSRLREWQTTLPLAKDLWMSVNLSGVQLAHEDVVEQITHVLRESALEARTLVLELTEGVAMENASAATSMLMRLRAMGVRISIDDFGTGYSSLAYLRQFPVDALKIDRSFVRGMESDKDTVEIVAGLIGMARQLGLHVVAEGVENDDQLVLLRSLHCDSAQGDLFARPLDVEKATALLRTGFLPRPELPRRGATAGLQQREPRANPFAGTSFASRGTLLIAAMILALLTIAGLAALPSRISRAIQSPAAPALSGSEGQQPPIGTRAEASASAVTPSDSPAEPAVRTTSFEVLHLHRIGSCRGRLVVSRDGVAFVRTDSSKDDAFAFNYSEFLYGLADDTLTVRTAAKTYRFKSAGRGDNEAALRGVVERIGRFREASRP